MYQLRIMLLAALPGNTLPFKAIGFILMLMNPLSIQQNCLHDTNSPGVQPSRYMTVTIPFLMTDWKSSSMMVKRHIWGATECTNVSQSLVLCLFFLGCTVSLSTKCTVSVHVPTKYCSSSCHQLTEDLAYLLPF